MHAALLYFWGFNNQDERKTWENQLENFLRYFSLTLAQKYHYALLKLTGLRVILTVEIGLSYKNFVLVCSTPRGTTIQLSDR